MLNLTYKTDAPEKKRRLLPFVQALLLTLTTGQQTHTKHDSTSSATTGLRAVQERPSLPRGTLAGCERTTPQACSRAPQPRDETDCRTDFT